MVWAHDLRGPRGGWELKRGQIYTRESSYKASKHSHLNSKHVLIRGEKKSQDRRVLTQMTSLPQCSLKCEVVTGTAGVR